MEVELEGAQARGLHRYVRLVADALGLAGEGWYVQLEPPASIYLPLPDRLDRLPDRDVALLWDEEHGWSFAVESHSSEDLLVLAYFGRDVLPAPQCVARFAQRLLAGDDPGEPVPPPLRDPAVDDGLSQRLAGYATSAHGEAGEAEAAADLLTIRVDYPELDVIVLRVSGEIDMLTVPQLDEWISLALRLLPEVLVLDLSAVRFLGSAGLSALLRARQLAAEHTRVRVVASGPATRRPLDLTGVSKSVMVYGSVADALRPPETQAARPAG